MDRLAGPGATFPLRGTAAKGLSRKEGRRALLAEAECPELLVRALLEQHSQGPAHRQLRRQQHPEN